MAGTVLEEYELLGDARYRSYVSAVDKALKYFECTSEWADLISALGKLNKVLLNHSKFQVIPRRITISKRLAQCMHPALPSGVHLKALETYDIIFKCIGSTRLSQELFIYSAGLFPLFANAAMNVKPSLLTVYETHFVLLGEKLRPGLNGFLIGILPGLEEGSDYYERTDVLLQKVCESVEINYFYGCLWKCILTNPMIRLPAINFVINHFNKKASVEDQLFLIGTDIDTMVQGLFTSLQDSSVLVQRSTLDLLLLGFPIHNNQLVTSDIVRIVTAAVTVVLRRDMSLNRRLFSWLLGGDLMSAPNATPSKVETSSFSVNSECHYFQKYSKDILLEALRICLDSSSLSSLFVHTATNSPDLWCYRLLISLLDRPEISSVILDDILIEVFRSLYLRCHSKEISKCENASSSNASYREVIKTANLLFATLEPWYLWTYSAKLFENACHYVSANREALSGDNENHSSLVQNVGSRQPTVVEFCHILDFLLEIVSLEMDLEARSKHLPNLLCHIAGVLSQNCCALQVVDISLTLGVCSKILSKMEAPSLSVDQVEQKCSYNSVLKHSFSSHSVSSKEDVKSTISCKCANGSDLLKAEQPVCTDNVENHSKDTLLPFSSIIVSISDCIKQFQVLLVNFLKEKLLSDLSETLKRFQSLLLAQHSDNSLRDTKLHRILNASLEMKCNCDTKEVTDIFKKDIEEIGKNENFDSHLHEETVIDNEVLCSAFKQLCHLIVELASFPTFCMCSKQTLEEYLINSDVVSLPEWLKLLTCMACCGSSEEISFTAMSTLFDIISITQSVYLNYKSCKTDSAESSCQTISVVSVPVMTFPQLQFLCQETLLFKAAATKLWRCIDSSQPYLCLEGSHLLQQLHNLCASSHVCEAVICNAMSSGDEMEQVEAQKKFCTLWHLTRDMSTKLTSPASFKQFDQCFFLMLDNLGKETGPQKAIAQSWLNHSLQRGDIARILEPLMLILLHPDSSRVSVQHVSVHCPDSSTVTDGSNQHPESLEAKIFAISSVSGNIIYHVSDNSQPSSRQSSPHKKILALTSLLHPESNKDSSLVTQNSMFKDFELPSCHERDLQLPISVFVNPFGSLSSLCSDSHLESSNLPDFSHVTRIEAVAKSFFDDDNFENSDCISPLENSSEAVVANIIDEIIDNIVKTSKHDSEEASSASVCTSKELWTYSDCPLNFISETASSAQEPLQMENSKLSEATVHPLHTHVLLYCQVYDSEKTLYALSSLKAVMLANPRVTLCSMATTNISNSASFRGQQMQLLLARHRKSVFGNDFHGQLNAEVSTIYRNSTFLETVVLVCMYYVRSYYPNLLQMKLTNEEIHSNRNVRLLCVELLMLVFSELVTIVKDSDKNFASYLSDLLLRCKVQKTLLHCLAASVHDLKVQNPVTKVTFTEVIVEFNDLSTELIRKQQQLDSSIDFQDTFQVHLLRLMSALIELEDAVSAKSCIEKESNYVNNLKSSECSCKCPDELETHSCMTTIKFQQGLLIPTQPLFLRAVLRALGHHRKMHMHIHWLSLVTSILPYAGRWLSHLVVHVVIQICCSLDVLSSSMKQRETERNDLSILLADKNVPPDYLILVIEGLTTLCHYCLLDCPPISNLLNPTVLPPIQSQSYAAGTSASQIISNLIHVFSASSNEKDYNSVRELGSALDPILSARRALLSNLPRIILSLSAVFQMISHIEKCDKLKALWIMGSPKVVKQNVLSFLSPISLNYGTNFIAAIAVIWHDQRMKNAPNRKVIPVWSPEQLQLVNLVSAIKVSPFESIVQSVRSILKQSPPVSQMNRVPVEVSTLQFFLSYIQNTSGTQLVESWQSLLNLWRDGLQLVFPQVQFHLLAILHEFVQRAPILEDRRAQKDLQDIAHRLIEACSTVASSSLEQTTWLWRNLAVRPGPQDDLLPPNSETEENTLEKSAFSSVGMSVESNDTSVSCTSDHDGQYSQYSVQALIILAKFLAPVLDFVYIGEEKDRVVPLLSNIMYYVMPYLRNHSSHNAPSFRACCQLLSSLSGYQHTRKSWRKDVFELLLDVNFFKMPKTCICYWKAIVDHLMTHDKTTFRDFMARVSVAQPGSLSLFSSKEQEYEQRAHLLKRLAFVLFCSEIDQYQKFLPDIQERLTECLKLSHVPSISAEVFLCFRVLLVRMSPQHVTSLWPVIITEMVQIFTQIEYELCTDSDEFRSVGGGFRHLTSSHLRRLLTLDSSWVTNFSNGLNAHNNPSWLHLYLSVCKLLDMAVALPASILPQFQMYRWAFVGDGPPLPSENNSTRVKTNFGDQEFVPHVTRLSRLLNKKTCSQKSQFIPGQLMLTMSSIQGLQQLQPFFSTLSDMSCHQDFNAEYVNQFNVLERRSEPILKSHSAPELYSLSHDESRCTRSCKTGDIIEQIEITIENDFIEV